MFLRSCLFLRQANRKKKGERKRKRKEKGKENENEKEKRKEKKRHPPTCCSKDFDKTAGIGSYSWEKADN